MRAIFASLIIFIAVAVQAQMKFGDMELPIRMTRTFGLSGNIGLKSLTGLGVTFQYYISPKVGLDAGVGISNYGYNLGARGRYIFLKNNFSPFAGAGFIYGTGSFNAIVSLEDIESGDEIWLVINPCRFVQIVGGAELVANKGFFLMFSVGVSILVHDNPYEIIQGNPSEAMESSLNIIYGTGFSTEVSIGYIFGNKGKYRGKF